MTRRRKLTDSDVERLRDLRDDGWTLRALADEFGVSRQHASRLAREEQRPRIGPLDAGLVQQGVGGAVEAFLADADLAEPGLGVLAAMARALAAKLDAATASAAMAAPRVAAQLVDVLERLRDRVPREPDALDLLRRRRAARLLAHAAANGNGPDEA